MFNHGNARMKNSISAVDSFLADIPILYPLKTLENQIIPGAFSGRNWQHWPEMG